MALECRIRLWQAVLYGKKLDRRYQKLIDAVDPLREAKDLTATVPAEEGRLSSEVLERIARDVAEEPLLLDRPKRPSQRPPKVEEPDNEEPQRIRFPGGVLPPRRSPESTPAPATAKEPSQPTLVRPAPAPAPRPRVESPQPQGEPQITDPDLDFSDVREALKERGGPARTPPPRTSSTWARDAHTRETLPPDVVTPPPTLEDVDATAATPPPPRPSPPHPSPPSPSDPDDALVTDDTLLLDASLIEGSPDDASRPGPPLPSPLPQEVSVSRVATPPLAPFFGRSKELPRGPIPPSAMEWSLDDAKRSLALAKEDRDQLVSVILRYGRRTFDFVAAFAVMKGAAGGWESLGEGADLRAIRQVSIPLDAASLFRTVALTRGSYIGPVPPDALSAHYLAILGRAPRTAFLWPIEVKSRLVTMVYGDCGPNPVSRRRLTDFVLFCQELPAAFHELIVFRRNSVRLSPIPLAPTGLSAAEPLPADQGQGLGPGPEWVANLIARLTGPHPADRSTAMTELSKHPEIAAPALGRAFPGPTGWSRRTVVDLPEPDELGPVPGALARMETDGAQALAPLLASTQPETRYLAMLTAGGLRHPEVLDGVWAGLFDLEPDVSSAARAAAAALRHVPGFDERLPELRLALSSTDARKQSLAAKALGALHDRPSIERLVSLTGSPDLLVAQSAAGALKDITRASFGTDRSLWTQWWEEGQTLRRADWLVSALSDGDPDTRQAALEELSKAFGDNCGFSSDAPEPQRAEAVQRWRALVTQRPEIELS